MPGVHHIEESIGMWRLFLTLYLLVAPFAVGFGLLTSSYIYTFHKDLVVEESTQAILGWLKIFDYLAEQQDSREWEALLEQISHETHWPASLLTSNDLSRQYPQAISNFEKNNIFFIDVENFELLYQLKNQQGVLHIGPLQPSEDGGFVDIERRLDYVFLFLLGVLIFLWQLHLWRKLVRLEQVAEAFGEGKLDARASEAPSIRVGNLNQSFNNMADKISQLIQQNRQLTRAISHELRSPISRLRCLNDLMDSASSSVQPKNYIDNMAEDITELEELVDEILNFTRMNTSTNIADLQKQTLKPVLQDVLLKVKREIDREIILNCDSDISAEIDTTLFQRAVGNLVRNAARYCANVVEVNVVHDSDLSAVLLHVDDDGPGIPLEHRQRIFEPFARIDQSRTRETGGYGLGLSIVKQIAEHHGGDVQVSTSPLNGARFTLTLQDAKR